MTITLFLNKENIIIDIITLDAIAKAKDPISVMQIAEFMPPLEITTNGEKFGKNSVAIQVTPIEFSLIGMYNPNLLED